MMTGKGRWGVFFPALAILTALAVAGCGTRGTGTPEGPGGPSAGGSIVIGTTYDAPTLDVMRTGTFHPGLWQIHDRLVAVDANGKFTPALAESWEVSPDNKMWTFRLRPGVKFHDGTPLDATAVKWFFDQVRDPAGTHTHSPSYAAIDEIEAPDATTVVFRLKTPWPLLLEQISQSSAGIVSPRAYQTHGEDYGVKVAVGSGPYRLVEWIPDDRLVLERNPDYAWGPGFLANQGPGYLDRITYKFFPEVATRVAELETGGVDILYGAPAREAQRLRASGKYAFHEKPMFGGALAFLGFNLERQPFDDVRVRQAFNHAIDKARILNVVYMDFGYEAHGYLPLTTAGHLPEPEKVAYARNLDRARALMAEAGWTPGPDGTLVKDGKKLRVSLQSWVEFELGQVAEVIQEQLRALGVEVDVARANIPASIERVQAGEVDLFLGLYGSPDANILNFFFHSRNAPFPNMSRVIDPELDRLLDTAMSADSIEEAIRIYQEADRYLIKQAPWVPLLYVNEIVAMNKRVQGYQVIPKTESYFSDVWLETR